MNDNRAIDGFFRGVGSFAADENGVKKSEREEEGGLGEIRNTHERSLGWQNT
jgi:hypothetical protein